MKNPSSTASIVMSTAISLPAIRASSTTWKAIGGLTKAAMVVR
jgi:hypothetical protein